MYIFYHNEIKLEVITTKISRSVPNIWKLRNRLLNNP